MATRMKTQPSIDVSDRERIAGAFGELASRGYLLPFASWEVCCASCGWTEVALQTNSDDELPSDLKTVWWDERTDSYAFCDDADATPQTSEFMRLHPDDDDDDDESNEAAADSVVARLTEYAMLVAPLYLHWRGDGQEIAAALRTQGLRVQVPKTESECIVVLPTVMPVDGQAVDGEVAVLVGSHQTILTVKDARRLARKLTRAARIAETQMPVW